MSKQRALVIEVVIAAPIDAVWHALRDPAAIRQWFGWDYPGLPEEIEYIFLTHANADEAAHRLTMGEDEIALEANGDRTIVRVTRAAPASGSWDDIYDDITEGWRTFVEQMRYAFAHHFGESRRTIFLSGRCRAEGAPAPPEALGLGPLSSAREGEAYSVATPLGEPLSGRVWFRSAWQIGLVVDAFGPGLLVAMRRPTTEKSPHGGGMFVLTLYGFDEASQRELTARWQEWFEGVFEGVEVQT